MLRKVTPVAKVFTSSNVMTPFVIACDLTAAPEFNCKVESVPLVLAVLAATVKVIPEPTIFSPVPALTPG